MKNFILLLLLLLLFKCCSCSPVIIRQVSKIADDKLPLACEGLNKLVNDGFYYVQEYDYYIFHKPTLYKKVIEDKTCISSLTSIEVKQIFGEPNFENTKGIYYHLSMVKKSTYKNYMPYSLIFCKEGSKILKAEIYIYKQE